MGEEFAGYVLLDVIGRGAGTVVHRAHRRGAPGRVVAVKVVDGADPARLDALRREARILDALAHPAILPAIETVEDRGRRGLVLPYAAGGSLADRLRSGPLPADEVADLGARLADALAAAHAAGVLHRDVTPTNILFGLEDEPRLADFGAAHLRTDVPAVPVGTAAYLAPDAARGAPPAPHHDLYGLGAVLYEAVTGRRPHGGATVEEVFAAAERGDHVPVDQLAPDAPPALVAAIEAALARDPDDRPASAQRLAGALAAVARDGEADRHRRIADTPSSGPAEEGADHDEGRPEADGSDAAAPQAASDPEVARTRAFGPRRAATRPDGDDRPDHRAPTAPTDARTARRPGSWVAAAAILLLAGAGGWWLVASSGGGTAKSASLQVAGSTAEPRIPAPPCDGQPAPGDDALLADVDGRGCSLVVRLIDTTVDGAQVRAIVLPPAAGDLAGRYRLADPGDDVLVGDWDCDGIDTPAVVRPNGDVFTYPGYGAVTAEPAGAVTGAPSVVTVDGCDRVVGDAAPGGR